MEEKLREYRAQRRRKELIENTKQKLEASKEKLVKFLTPKFLTEMRKEKNEDEVLLMENENVSAHSDPMPEPLEAEAISESSEIESFEPENSESWKKFTIRWTFYIIAWLTCYAFFLQLQFGAVYFVISLLVGIYLNTGTRPKKKGEVSAYSVFNENCVSIDGTLKAEQLEKEMLFGVANF